MDTQLNKLENHNRLELYRIKLSHFFSHRMIAATTGTNSGRQRDVDSTPPLVIKVMCQQQTILCEVPEIRGEAMSS